MTELREFFVKPVDRPIDGVIKADDAASLEMELEEYVITNEIKKRLEDFLDAYNNYETANGVWISGFFGSGKSHLLKMLAVLLENRVVSGKQALEIFEPNLADEPMLRGALHKAVSSPSKSILFNIDQKADVISKDAPDALLSVFQKVFDEACGYYGKLPHIAQFERTLDAQGLFEKFKEAFADLAGKPWEVGREQALLERKNIDGAFAVITGTDASETQDVLGKFREDTRVSIEDFAKSVKDWIDQQGANFRLNFFVDEVGQYIADNVKLMTNLQTVAESLNTKCRGQAWIIVTSQQDIGSVVGDRTVQQENDFSKIQARFGCRMPLQSHDVEEVIQRRLLSKTPSAQVLLNNLYDREKTNFGTLFGFVDGSISLKNFRDQDHFVRSYPFPSYQYDLFQMAIKSLSEHNAFEGRHSSVGERSMLGVFQEVAKQLLTTSPGDLATFDLMFDGIQTALKSGVQQSIQLAKKNLGSDFAVRVLKVLFLTKYVKEFKPTVRNISILLLSRFDQDQTQLRRDIEDALKLLEQNTLIQRNGEAYEFLTNEEKDIEAEIKTVEVDQSDLSDQLGSLFFDGIVKRSKIQHAASSNEYPYTRILDDRMMRNTRERELGINLISPMNEEASSIEVIRSRNGASEELAIVLENDTQFVRELRVYKQTEKFLRQSRNDTHQAIRTSILAEKGEQNQRREKDLTLQLDAMITKAKLFVRGDELEIGGKAPQDRVIDAFQLLVDKVYTSLGMLRGIKYDETLVAKALEADGGLFGSSGTGLSEPEQDVLNHLQQKEKEGLRVAVLSLTDRFGKKPYGWPPAAVLCAVASLVTKSKCEARSDSTVLEGTELVSALNNSHQHANILLTPQVEFTAAKLRQSRELYQELFGIPASSNDARGLAQEWAVSARNLTDELKDLLAKQSQYPFIKALKPLKERLADMDGKPTGFFIEQVLEQEDDLLEAKEEILDKIKTFLAGPQKGIYDDVRQFLTEQQANLAEVPASDVEQLQKAIDDPDCFKGSAMQSLNTQFRDLKTSIETQVVERREQAVSAMKDCIESVVATSEFSALDAQQQQSIRSQLERRQSDLDQISTIATLRERESHARGSLFADTMNVVASASSPSTTAVGAVNEGAMPINYVHVQQLPVSIGKPYLTDEDDVDLYVDKMKNTLLAEIRAGKKVTV